MNLENIFATAYSYQEYRALVDKLVAEGKTTGDTQNDRLLEFTKLNIQRMNRIDKTVQLSQETISKLSQSTKSYKWLLIGDAWCGDCAQIIPVINKIAESVPDKIILKIVSRDTHAGLVEKYNPNGSKSIPRLLILEKLYEEPLTTWGPRPKPAQDIMLNWKNNQDTITWEDFEKSLHLWYAKDKGQTIINELVAVIDACEKK